MLQTGKGLTTRDQAIFVSPLQHVVCLPYSVRYRLLVYSGQHIFINSVSNCFAAHISTNYFLTLVFKPPSPHPQISNSASLRASCMNATTCLNINSLFKTYFLTYVNVCRRFRQFFTYAGWWNESDFRPLLCTYRLNWTRRASWGWWDEWDDTYCPPDTGFEIQTSEILGRARYLSVTEAPHNTEFYDWMGKKHFSFFLNRRDRETSPEPSWKAAVLTTTLGPPPVLGY